MKRAILGFFLALCAAVAWAYPAAGGTGTEPAYTVKPAEPWLGSAAEACERERARLHNANRFSWASSTVTTNQTKQPTNTTVNGEQVGDCVVHWVKLAGQPAPASGDTERDLHGRVQSIPYSCPNGGTLEGSNCVCGPGEIDTGSTCSANSCTPKAGQTTTKNITLGWQSGLFDNGAIEFKPDGSKAPKGYYGPRPSDGPLCVSGCKMDLGSIEDVWVSEKPNPNGLYRISGDYSMTYSGAACSATATDDGMASPTAPPPEADCAKGEVNGKPVCVPESVADRNTTPAQGGNNAKRGNPSAGTEGGSGTGDIPEAGQGGNEGGPKAAGDGGTRTPSGTKIDPPGTPPPTGNVEAPGEGEEQAACGAPGQPKCLIDETGTPSGEGALGEGDGSAASTEAGFLSEIVKAQQLQAPQWTWTFELPSGCAPFVMEAFNMTINVCQWQPMIHDLMSIMWIMAAVFLCVRMVFTTVNKG